MALVLVHGLGGRAEDWTPLIVGLADRGFHIYAPDLLGFGSSQAPDVPYSVPLEAHIVEGFIAELHLQHVVLAGWSAGGWVAQTVALDLPDSVERLLLYNSAGIHFPLDWAPRLYGTDTLEGVAEFAAKVSPNSRPLPRFLARDFLRMLRRGRWINLRMLSSMMEGRDMLDDRLPALKAPTVLIWGAIDTMTPINTAERMHQLIPNSTLVRIEGCGHLAPAECTPAVLDATLRFLHDPNPARGGTISYPKGATKPSLVEAAMVREGRGRS